MHSKTNFVYTFAFFWNIEYVLKLLFMTQMRYLVEKFDFFYSKVPNNQSFTYY